MAQKSNFVFKTSQKTSDHPSRCQVLQHFSSGRQNAKK